MEKPVYPSGMPRVERRKLRDEYAAFLMNRKQEGRPVQVKVVERVIVETVKPDLSDTLAKMEAAAARAAQPGANIPPAIKELMDENLTDEQNVEKLRQRWSELTGRNVALASGSQVFEPLTDAERKELTTLNSWDKLRGA